MPGMSVDVSKFEKLAHACGENAKQAGPRGGHAVIDAPDGDDWRQTRVLNPQHPREFALEMQQAALRGRLLVEMVERAPDKIVQLRRRLFRFGRKLDEFDEVRRERNPMIIVAKPHARIAQGGFAKRVKFALRAPRDADLALKKKIENPGEATLRAQRSFGDCLDPAQIRSEPRDDEARVAESDLAQQNGRVGFHGDARRMPESGAREKKSFLQKPFAASSVLGYRTRPLKRSLSHKNPIIMSEESRPAAPQQSQIPTDSSNLKTSYANVVGIAANINEVYLTFGMNTDPYNPTPAEAVKLDNRVVMTPDAAKRLCLNLNATLAAFEQRFGVIELDLQKRLRG